MAIHASSQLFQEEAETTTFCPLSTQPVFLNGQIQTGAYINVYDAGTLTPRTAYKDGLALSPWAQVQPGSPPPVGSLITDANGTIPPFWITGNPYRVRIWSAGGVQIRDVDNLPGDVATGGGGGGTQTLNTGDYIFSHTPPLVVSGRVRANGKTIGSAVSGATEFASSTCQNLFVFLWNNDGTLTVSGGRGASASADWNANKTIALPDMNGRTPIGIDGMGTSPTGRLTGATFSSGTSGTVGSVGGTAQETITQAQMPSHLHSGTTNANTAFQMTFTTAAAGSHSHTGQTSGENVLHQHYTSGTTSGQSADHSHTGYSDAIGSHTHAVNDAGHAHSYNQPGGGIFVGGGAALDYNIPVGGTTSVSATGINLQAAGVHQHAIQTYGTSNDHTHTWGNWSGTENQAHVHFISVDGNHVHTGTTDLGGVHTHLFTTGLTGGGTAQNNVQPFLLGTWYLVL